LKIGKYRKKPVVIETFRWTGGHDQVEDPVWAKDALMKGTINIINGELFIHTKEGVMQARSGDYIIRGVQGEIYPCKPDIFEVTYDLVQDEPV